MPVTNRITIQHLIHLKALVQERHVTRAADSIGIGQPAMSISLAKLRLIFKDPLLVKTSRGMEPTPRAVLLAKRASEVVELLEGRSGNEDHFDPLTDRTHFRIMASDGITRFVAPELLRIAGTAAPQMRFTVSPGDARRAGEYLRDGDVDIVIAFLRRPAVQLRRILLYPQKLVCIARQGHPTVKSRISLKQFVSQSHAVWGAAPVPYPTMEAMVEEALEAQGLSRQIVLRVSSVTLLTDIVAKTDLLAVVPELLALTSSQTMPIQVVPLPFDVARVDVSMLWHDRLHRDPAHKWLRSTLKSVGKQWRLPSHLKNPGLNE